jgi:predicted transcriptional regulator
MWFVGNSACRKKLCTPNGKIKSQIYLTPEQLKIIDFIDQVGRISARDVENILSSPKRTAQLHLQKLKKIKMIKAVGKGKSTSYIANSLGEKISLLQFIP